MNLRELFEPLLAELKMNPGNLRALAIKIPAVVGIEYELAARDVVEYADHSGRPRNFDDIEDYFYHSTGRLALRGVIRLLEEDFRSWATDQIQNNWDSVDGEKWFRRWIRNNLDNETMAQELGLSPDSDNPDLVDDFQEHCVQEQNKYWSQAMGEYFEQNMSEYAQKDFLQDKDLITYEQVQAAYPHLELPSDGVDDAYALVAQNLRYALKKETDWSTEYQGAGRGDWYSVEPDSSISVNKRQDLPVEIVSPAQNLSEALADYRKIRDWALDADHYTNHSTGLHINVSLTGKSMRDLVWVKLVLLSGDEWVLNQFGRSYSHYAQNALTMMMKTLERNRPGAADTERRTDPVLQDALLNLTSDKLSQVAKQLAEPLMKRSHLSIVVKSNRIEVRSPGGNWLSLDPEVIENTVYRYVVALDAAMDPTKYREDYLKKLYQMVQGNEGDWLTPLFKLQVGMITREQFRKLIKQRYTKTPLTELFERPLKYSPLFFDEDGGRLVSWFYVNHMIYVFMAVGPEIQFRMIEPELTSAEQTIIDQNPYDKDVWKIIKDQFISHGHLSMRNTGFANKIMGTIINIFDNFMRSKSPRSVVFSSATGDRGRVNLYRRLARLAGARYNYRVDEYTLDSVIEWELIKKSE